MNRLTIAWYAFTWLLRRPKVWRIKRQIRERVSSWDRVRFMANDDDYRPVSWPPNGPYWCTGYGSGYSVVVAYIPHGSSDDELKQYWPEAESIERLQEGVQIEYSDRFPKPDWWEKR